MKDVLSFFGTFRWKKNAPNPWKKKSKMTGIFLDRVSGF